MSKETDKELLALAASAARYDISHPINTERQEMMPPVLGLVTSIDGEIQSTLWNPLQDDGHALRLAVKLGILSSPAVLWAANDASCQYAATRRAIVRAAAEIGRKL